MDEAGKAWQRTASLTTDLGERARCVANGVLCLKYAQGRGAEPSPTDVPPGATTVHPRSPPGSRLRARSSGHAPGGLARGPRTAPTHSPPTRTHGPGPHAHHGTQTPARLSHFFLVLEMKRVRRRRLAVPPDTRPYRTHRIARPSHTLDPLLSFVQSPHALLRRAQLNSSDQ
eukprot:scaffold18391_cov70-Phaeocystis_antarctica.AAC.2